MLQPELDHALSQIELQCESVALALATGEPQALLQASEALRQIAQDFSELTQGLPAALTGHPDFKRRVKKIVETIGIQREGLIRRSVFVERALHAILPAARTTPTYEAAGATSYGRALRQTGAFKVLSA